MDRQDKVPSMKFYFKPSMEVKQNDAIQDMAWHQGFNRNSHRCRIKSSGEKKEEDMDISNGQAR